MSTGEQSGKDPQPIAPAKFWLKSALVIVVMGIVLAWAWTPSRHEEPFYQGKTLRVWLKTYVDSDRDREAQAEAVAAIRKIGTNGIPTLLRMIQAPDSNFRTKLKALMGKQTLIKPNFQDAADIRDTAFWGFEVLRDDAKGAVPELLTLAKKPSGTDGRGHAIGALGHIGPSAKAAVPLLLAIASDATDRDRGAAIYSLGLIRSSAESVVPLLESCLRDPVVFIRTRAASALSKYGDAAQSSVPSLIPLLADPSNHVRQQATNALKHIDPAAATKAGVP
jgi:HEAT repeat protein